MAQYPAATIPATEVREFQSTLADQVYQISVALPFGYEEHPHKTYPVIYLSDANLYFGMVVDMVRAMNIRVSICDELPDAIIVGIGYPVSGPLKERLHHVMNLRDRDFTPERDEASAQMMQEFFPLPNPVANGGGRQFLQFVMQELVPLIEPC
jgi:uncharacterized protein